MEEGDAPVNPVNPAHEKPASVAIVKKTQIARPKELAHDKALRALEEKHAKIEDRLDGIDGCLKGINDWLEKAFPSGRAATAKEGSGPSLLEDLDNDLFGKD